MNNTKSKIEVRRCNVCGLTKRVEDFMEVCYGYYWLVDTDKKTKKKIDID